MKEKKFKIKGVNGTRKEGVICILDMYGNSSTMIIAFRFSYHREKFINFINTFFPSVCLKWVLCKLGGWGRGGEKLVPGTNFKK